LKIKYQGKELMYITILLAQGARRVKPYLYILTDEKEFEEVKTYILE